MGLSRRQPDHEHKTTSILSRLWAGLSLLGAIPAFAAMALLEGEGSGDGSGGSGDGGNKPGDGGQGGAAGTGGVGGAAQPFRSFADQAEFDKHAAGIKREAERNALKAVAEQLGCTVDEAKTFLAERKAAEDAKLSEVEKREQAAAEAERKAAERDAAATAKERRATIAMALAGAAVSKDCMDYASDAVARELGDNEATDEAVTAAVEVVKTKVPAFFGEAGKPPVINPSGGPRGGGAAPKTGIEAGRERGRETAAAAAAANNPLEGFRVLGRSA